MTTSSRPAKFVALLRHSIRRFRVFVDLSSKISFGSRVNFTVDHRRSRFSVSRARGVLIHCGRPPAWPEKCREPDRTDVIGVHTCRHSPGRRPRSPYNIRPRALHGRYAFLVRLQGVSKTNDNLFKKQKKKHMKLSCFYEAFCASIAIIVLKHLDQSWDCVKLVSIVFV